MSFRGTSMIDYYNNERTHTGKYCFGKTPMQTLLDSKHLADEKMLDLLHKKEVNLPMSGQAEAGNGGDQPARNNLTDRNDEGADKSHLSYNHFGSDMP